MTVTATTHVNFRGQARAALDFYRSVFGGQTAVATYRDIHAAEDETHADEVAFGRLDAPSGFRIMAYDVQPSKRFDAGTNAFYITLNTTSADEASAAWDLLAGDGTILIPLGPAPFAPLYGMLTDRFGVTWIVGADDTPGS